MEGKRRKHGVKMKGNARKWKERKRNEKKSKEMRGYARTRKQNEKE